MARYQPGIRTTSRPGIGQFAGNPPDPSDPTQAISRQLRDSLGGDPGLRLAGQMARRGRTYHGTGLTIQAFIPTMGGSNSPEALDVNAVEPIKRNRSRALGQFRGLPEMSTPDA
jgi:hypothetical protein